MRMPQAQHNRGVLDQLACCELVRRICWRWWGTEKIGGAEGIRTLDPHDANVVLSQLSYRPNPRTRIVSGAGRGRNRWGR